MEKEKLIKFVISALIMYFILMPNSKAQVQLPLSQDPLYHIVFQDTFGTNYLDTTRWFTGMGWWAGKGANTNFENSCGNPLWDIPYCRQWPRDTANRKYHATGYPNYQTLISKAENFNDTVIVYNPCPSGICKYHGDTTVKADQCFTNGTDWCMYDSVMPFKYSSAIMRSHYMFTDGYFEIRYRLTNYPDSLYNAFGPNFWLYGGGSKTSDSADYSEIDIFEMEGQKWKMGSNIHYRNQNPKIDSLPTHPGDTVFWNAVGGGPLAYNPYPPHMFPDGNGNYNGGTWHTVGCEWTPAYTDFYFDNSDTIRRYSNSKLPIHNLDSMYILIGTEMMPPDNYCLSYTQGKSPPSINYDIDYVKVYQINQVAGCLTNADSLPNGFTTNNFTSQLYKDVNIGGSGTAVLNSGSYHIAGQDYVLLQSGFEVSGTATVIISTMPCQTKKSATYNPVSRVPAFDPPRLIDLQKAKRNNNQMQ